MPPVGKWKKRYCVLRFGSANGPLVLECSKDEKPSSTKEKELFPLVDIEAVDKVCAIVIRDLASALP